MGRGSVVLWQGRFLINFFFRRTTAWIFPWKYKHRKRGGGSGRDGSTTAPTATRSGRPGSGDGWSGDGGGDDHGDDSSSDEEGGAGRGWGGLWGAGGAAVDMDMTLEEKVTALEQGVRSIQRSQTELELPRKCGLQGTTVFGLGWYDPPWTPHSPSGTPMVLVSGFRRKCVYKNCFLLQTYLAQLGGG